ncbi:MAG: tRNA adenosine(34) deaminase TadA [Gammaproteobacteria bacterium]
MSETDNRWMQVAIQLAEQAARKGEVPVGAIIVMGGQVIGEGWNQPISTNDPTAHAEIMAIRNAAIRIKNYRLTGTTLYVTLEPCLMCAGSMVHARIERLVYGATDPKRGAVNSTCHALESQGLNHRIQVEGGVMAAECGGLLQTFFREKRG